MGGWEDRRMGGRGGVRCGLFIPVSPTGLRWVVQELLTRHKSTVAMHLEQKYDEVRGGGGAVGCVRGEGCRAVG